MSKLPKKKKKDDLIIGEDNTVLAQMIFDDKNLQEDKEKRLKYISFANLFSDDLMENLNLTSLELDDKYFTSDPIAWRDFLKYPPVAKFVDGFLTEKAERVAMKTLGEGSGKASDALKVKQMVDSKRNENDNSNIVVVFLPQKEYRFE